MADLGAIVKKISEARALGTHGPPSTPPAPPPKPEPGELIRRYPTVSLLCGVAIVGVVAIAILIPIFITRASGPPATRGAAMIQATGPVTVAPARAVAIGPLVPSGPLVDGPAETTGTLSGIIRMEGDPPVRRIVGTLPSGSPILDESLLVDPQSNGIANAVVYLVRPPAGATIPPAPASPSIFGISAATHVPHVLMARMGQEVVAVNSDPVPRSVHSAPYRNEAINAVVPPAFAASWRFTKAETRPVRITSDFDPWMTAWIVVLDHPWVAITDKSGAFKIEGLPSGTREFTIWHEWGGGLYLARKVAVTIDERQTSELNLSIPASRFGDD